jgi:hypothetical protein
VQEKDVGLCGANPIYRSVGHDESRRHFGDIYIVAVKVCAAWANSP